MCLYFLGMGTGQTFGLRRCDIIMKDRHYT